MKLRVLYILCLSSLFAAFWACGDGDIYHSDAEDWVAVEKLGNMSDKEREALMEKCKADSKCRAEMEKYPEMLSSSSEEEPPSSSSEEKPESSSQKESSSAESAQSSSDSEKSSSSKKDDESSSSVKSASSSSATSSSSESDDSSSSAKEPSSSDENSSSSSVESSSSAESSSAEPEPESSSSEPEKPASSSSAESSSSLAPPHGTCAMTNSRGETTTIAQQNEPVTLTYTPDEGTSAPEELKWSIGLDYEKIYGDLRSSTLKIKFTDSPGNGGNVVFQLKNSDKVCDPVQINIEGYYEDTNSSSSDNGDTPVDPNQPTSSPTDPSSSGSSGSIEYDDDDGGTSASSSGGSGDAVTAINDFDPNGTHKVLDAGTYRIDGFKDGGDHWVCNVDIKEGSQTIQEVLSLPNSDDWGTGWNTGATVTIRPNATITILKGRLEVQDTGCWK